MADIGIIEESSPYVRVVHGQTNKNPTELPAVLFKDCIYGLRNCLRLLKMSYSPFLKKKILKGIHLEILELKKETYLFI